MVWLLGGKVGTAGRERYEYEEIEYPDGCIGDFDMHRIDLFNELSQKSLTVKGCIWQG